MLKTIHSGGSGHIKHCVATSRPQNLPPSFFAVFHSFSGPFLGHDDDDDVVDDGDCDDNGAGGDAREIFQRMP